MRMADLREENFRRAETSRNRKPWLFGWLFWPVFLALRGELRAVLSRTARFFEPIAKIVRNPKRGLLTRPP